MTTMPLSLYFREIRKVDGDQRGMHIPRKYKKSWDILRYTTQGGYITSIKIHEQLNLFKVKTNQGKSIIHG